ALDDLAEQERSRLHVPQQKGLREAHHAENVREVLLLLRAARVRWLGEPGAFVDQRLDVLERDLGAGRQAVPERILRLVGPRQFFTGVRIAHSEISPEVRAARRSDDQSAVEEGTIIGIAAVRLLELPFDQLGADEPAIGGAMQNGSARLPDPL